MRQPVRTSIQLRVTQLLFFIDQGRYFRRPLHLLFKPLMNTLLGGKFRCGLIPLQKNSTLLMLRKQTARLVARSWCGSHPAQTGEIVIADCGNLLAAEFRGVVIQLQL